MIKFNKNNGTIEPFTIILSNRNQDHLGEIVNTEAVNYTGNFNSADELSFTVNKIMNGREERLWDEIYDLRLIYIKELNEYFEISVSFTDQTYLVKTITAKSLCEAELSQTMLYDIEINTETDIDRPDYKVAKFWTTSTDKQSSEYKNTILYRVLEKVPAYSVKHVDSTLVNLQRVFTINGKSVYDWLVGDCATEFNCLVKFDSTDRTISFYDLYTTCPVCHSRGMFNDKCTHILTAEEIEKYNIRDKEPGDECGNKELNYLGEDTTIYVSTENLTDSIQFQTDIDSVKNCFRLNAGDDDMTAAVVNINPNGSQYIYNFSNESLRDMPNVLVDALKEYKKLYDEYNSHKNFPITLQSYTYYEPYEDIYVTRNYNDLVDKYNIDDRYYHAKDEDLIRIENPIDGYVKLMQHIYQCYDFYSYLESSMMPTVQFDTISARTEANKLNANNMGTVISLSSFSDHTTSDTVNSALINYAKVFVKTGFVKVEIDQANSSYEYNSNTGYGRWYGRFKISDYSLNDDDSDKVAYSSYLGFSVNDNYDTFIKQKIMKKISATDNNDNQVSLYQLFEIKDSDYKNPINFKNALRFYSLNRLNAFKDAAEAVLGVLQEAKQAKKGALLYDDFYLPYYYKFKACESEYNARSNELKIIANYTSGYLSSGVLYDLLQIRGNVQGILNIKDFLDDYSNKANQNHYAQYPLDKNFVEYDLYKLLTTYIRQDEYNNSNYISTGLSNNDMFQVAQMFYDAAYEELIKSSNYQHSISANLYNLLALDEFKPLIDKFELGNWIRVQLDGTVYRLRLISYSINFDDPNYINTQFSDLTATALGYNDLQSILNQAHSMAGSYGAVTRQAELGKLANDDLDKWVKTGLNSAKTRIMNNDAEEIEITNVGITARTFNDETDTYDDEQLRITHNVLAFTEDNWETVSTALGKFTLTHHIPHSSDTTPVVEESYGLVSQAVLSGWVVGTHIESSDIISSHIQNPGNTNYINFETSTDRYSDFIHVGDGFRIDKAGNFSTSGGHFSNLIDSNYLDLNDSSVPYSYFLKCGDKFFVEKQTGTIKSYSGHFQNIGDTCYIDFGSLSNDSDIDSLAEDELIDSDLILIDEDSDYDYFICCGDNFNVTKQGIITAKAGKIGCFTLNSTSLYTSSNISINTGNSIGLSNSPFTRSMLVTYELEDNGSSTVGSISSHYVDVNNLVFAIGSSFGVTTSGQVYGNDCSFDKIFTRDVTTNTVSADRLSSLQLKTEYIYTDDALGLRIQNLQIFNNGIIQKYNDASKHLVWSDELSDSIDGVIETIESSLTNISAQSGTFTDLINVGSTSGWHSQIQPSVVGVSYGNQYMLCLNPFGDRGSGLYCSDSNGHTLWYVNSSGFHSVS